MLTRLLDLQYAYTKSDREFSTAIIATDRSPIGRAVAQGSNRLNDAPLSDRPHMRLRGGAVSGFRVRLVSGGFLSWSRTLRPQISGRKPRRKTGSFTSSMAVMPMLPLSLHPHWAIFSGQRGLLGEATPTPTSSRSQITEYLYTGNRQGCVSNKYNPMNSISQEDPKRGAGGRKCDGIRWGQGREG